MAFLTYKTFLMEGTTSGNTTTWAKLIDIIDTPDLASARDAVDVTTLSDRAYVYVPGLEKGAETLPFNTWYDKAKYDTIKAKRDTKCKFAIWLGGTESDGVVMPTGSEGKFEFEGYPDVTLLAATVNNAHKMRVDVTRASAITKVA